MFIIQLYIFKCLKRNCDRCDNAFVVIFFKQCIIKQLLDEVFVISRIIKVSVSVISLSLRLRLITLTSTLIIPDITKTSSNNCLQFVHRVSFVTYRLKRAYLLRILALEASSLSQITFYIITNVLTSYFERFGLTVLRKYTFRWWWWPFLWLGYRLVLGTGQM